MSPQFRNALAGLACGLYRGLLHAYPQDFRSRYGAEMTQLFRDNLRDALSNHGIPGFARFCMRTAWDLLTSVLRERFTLGSVVGMLCLAAALGFSFYAEYVDRHNATEVYPTLMVALVGSFILGLAQPSWPWRWAIIVGLGVPFFGPLSSLFARLASPGRWAMLAVLLVPGLIGAYTGSVLRRALTAPLRDATP
jgi:hypothetical protein